MQHPTKVQKQMSRLEGMMKEFMKGQKQAQCWDCACGTAANWQSRNSCRGCGAAKDEPVKPKTPSSKETPENVEVDNLDEQVREQEELVKALSGECTKGSQRETMQKMAKEKLAELKAAARGKKPLPAQFQAAADALAKAQKAEAAAQEEEEEELQRKLKEATEKKEALQKARLQAEQQLEAVKEKLQEPVPAATAPSGEQVWEWLVKIMQKAGVPANAEWEEKVKEQVLTQDLPQGTSMDVVGASREPRQEVSQKPGSMDPNRQRSRSRGPK